MNYKYEDVFNNIKSAIDNKTFLPTEKLPSLRKMAQQYSCAISVIIQAYSQLEVIGYIKSIEKSGYIVLEQSYIPMPSPEKADHNLLPNITKVNLMTSEMVDMAMDKTIIPFGAAVPDSTVVASKKLATYVSRIAKNSNELFTMYSPSYGSLNLRKEIVKYMFKKGVTVTPNDIVITNGCSEALYLSLKILTNPGDNIAIESPTYFSLISILEELKLKTIEIPTRADSGLDIQSFKRALEKREVKALVFSSTFQNPLCSVMDQADLKELYDLSMEHNFTLIEDDIYGDCGFDDTVYNPLKVLDKDNRVIYCSSFSKTISPGVRVGWAIPGVLIDKFRELKHISCLGGPLVIQEAVAEYLKDGGYEIHIKSFRKKIYNQTYQIRSLVQKYFPEGIKVTEPRGGYFLWVEFPIGFDSFELYKEAYKNRVGIVPGPVFSVSENFVNCIRLSCGSEVNENSIAAIKLLGSLSNKILIKKNS